MSRVMRADVALMRVAAVAVLALGLSGCSSSGSNGETSPTAGSSAATATSSTAPSSTGPASAGSPTTASGSPGAKKVLLIMEENEEYGNIIGSSNAPRINALAKQYGLATNVQAGYPTNCPSLPAYLILTSGAQHGVCDDKNPVKHQISGGNLYQQVADAGLQYRQYAESMPNPCMDTNTSDNRYLVRHAPVPYYVSEKQRCQQWDVPLGTSTSGALHDAVKSGSLPAFSFVTPDACNDMHGEPVCGLSKNQLISTGDSWAGNWVDQITAGPDFKSGKLTIVLTWDEGSRSSNHLPVVVISPKTSHVSSSTAYSHCSTLRTMEDLLALKPLNCAATATSMVSEFHLG